MQKNLKYHHLGIPTKEKREGETYIEQFKVYVSGYETSPYTIEWMRFEECAPSPKLVKTVPHIAFEVDDLNKAIKGKEILVQPNSPSEGITVAFNIDASTFDEVRNLRDTKPREILKFLKIIK